jgi:NADH-quinone oxidoreductase subunit G
MIEIEIDGRKVNVPAGGTVMDGASELGIHIPHFCYHRKLTVAASCRMCLVDVDKVPKPLPACATPATPGMVVRTASEKARQAQASVMEFLLINHPLDCPICDQGGECQLQDLSVGYGQTASRYTEEKRVVLSKNLGPLVSAQEMARCIHCTRCVRFGQEIAGVMEMGMTSHGEYAEIMPFVGKAVESELSGNMIDVCPVGALTSKPFRYQARTWELARRKGIAPHDSLGSNIVLQVKRDKVLRVVPQENEAVNECWISDRDRFSYEGLDSVDRLTKPMVRKNGTLQPVCWTEALAHVTSSLQRIRTERGAEAVAALASGGATAEELYLLGKLVRGLGSQSIDARPRQADFSADGSAVAPWLGMPVAHLEKSDRILLVGSFLRQDHPVLATRLRKAVKAGARLSVLHAADDNLLMRVTHKAIAAPSAWLATVARIAQAVATQKGLALPAGTPAVGDSDVATAIAADLCSGEHGVILLGNAAGQHPQAAQLQAWLAWIAQATGTTLGVIGESANSVGAYLTDAVPGAGGLNARSMFEQPRAAYLLWGIEPDLDVANPAVVQAALTQAEAVISFSAVLSPALQAHAHVVLPIAAFAETFGTFVNTEGLAQSFQGAVIPPGDARPGWKVLRVLGTELGLDGFAYESPEAVRTDALPSAPRRTLSNAGLAPTDVSAPVVVTLPERLADIPPYAIDPLVRRAPALQATPAARAPVLRASAGTLADLGVQPGDTVKVTQQGGSATLGCVLDDSIATGVVRVAAAHPATASLGALFGTVTVERV